MVIRGRFFVLAPNLPLDSVQPLERPAHLPSAPLAQANTIEREGSHREPTTADEEQQQRRVALLVVAPVTGPDAVRWAIGAAGASWLHMVNGAARLEAVTRTGLPGALGGSSAAGLLPRASDPTGDERDEDRVLSVVAGQGGGRGARELVIGRVRGDDRTGRRRGPRRCR